MAIFDRRALTRGPRRDLAFPRSCMKVSQRGFVRYSRHAPHYAHLPFKRWPIKYQGSEGIGGKLLAFLTFIIAKEEKTLGADFFKKHRARGRLCLRIRRCQDHGVRLRHGLRQHQLIPRVKDTDGILGLTRSLFRSACTNDIPGKLDARFNDFGLGIFIDHS